jgi:hypothetical protein
MSEMNSINEREGPAKEALSVPQMDLSGMLGKLLANPQIIESVASALSSGNETAPPQVSGNAQAVSSGQKSEQVSEEQALPDIASMAQKLPEIMSMLGPVMQQKSDCKSKSEQNSVSSDKRACLLSAMKPYMSPQRCAAIDYIIKFSQISEILKKIN